MNENKKISMTLGLIGKSLSHSFSKSYFEKKFLSEKTDSYSYLNFDLENLESLVKIISENNIDGLNVTKPYKESVIPFLNELDEMGFKNKYAFFYLPPDLEVRKYFI